MYSEDMLWRTPTELSCPNCNRTGILPIGPAKERALCDHCLMLFPVPQPRVGSTRRRMLTWIGSGLTAIIANLLTPNWRVWDLFRAHVQPINVSVGDKIELHDSVAHSIVGNKGIPSGEAFGVGGRVTNG
jgi:hypothetical protein